MKVWPKRVRWAWILPVGELLLAGVVAGPQLIADHRVSKFLNSPARPAFNIVIPDIANTAPPRPTWKTRISDLLPERTHAVALANVPGLAVDAAVVLWRRKPTIGIGPTFGFDRWAWTAMLYPIYALPFWWSLGRCIDASKSPKSGNTGRLRWWDLTLMLPVAVIGIGAAIDYLLTATPADRADSQFTLLMIALGIWGVFSAFASIIWFRQWQRSRRRVRLDG